MSSEIWSLMALSTLTLDVALAEQRAKTRSPLAELGIDVLGRAPEHGGDRNGALILDMAQDHAEAHPRRQASQGTDEIKGLDLPGVRRLRIDAAQPVEQCLMEQAPAV